MTDKAELDALNDALKYSIFVQTGCEPIIKAAQSYADHFAEIQALKSGEWVLVPVEPDIEMHKQGLSEITKTYHSTQCDDVYKAMIAARPTLKEIKDNG